MTEEDKNYSHLQVINMSYNKARYNDVAFSHTNLLEEILSTMRINIYNIHEWRNKDLDIESICS